MGRLLRLIAIALAVTLLAAIQGAQCDEGQIQPAPTEYECRPYIEKALQGLANPEAPAEVIEDTPAADEGTEDPEGTRQKRSTDDGSSEESGETQPEEATTTSDEETVTPIEEQASASEEAGVPTEEQVPASEEEGMPTTDEALAVEGTSVEETSSEELPMAEGDATIEETSSEEVVPTADDEVQSSEDSEPSVEEIATGAEESKPSAEEASGEVAEAEVPEADDSGSSEESSMEVMQGDAPAAEEAEQTVESTESAEESTEHAGEQTAESAESTEQTIEESTETTSTAEEAVEPSERTADESLESTEQAAEDSVESTEQPEGESAESSEQAAAEGESVEQMTEGETTDEAPAVEESAESIEQGEVSEPTEETAESTESTESAEQDGEEPAVESAESTEQADQAAEEASASDESAEQAADVETVEGEAIQAEAVEGDAAEVEADEGVATVEEAASEGSGEEAAVEEAAIEATEEVSLDAVQVDEVEAEPTPEEELSFDVEIPENLRPREHIAQILRLDEESIEDELLIGKTVDTTLKDLKRFYDTAIKPLEILYKYRDLSNRHFGDPEIFSKPLILFMGPWSGGKSSIINYLLDNEYKRSSLRTGAEPSPAYFNILMHGEREEVLDGTQLAADWTFSGLQKFGQGLLDRLRGLRLNNRLLEKVNIVEIPGILEIRKQVERLFPFNDACQWFIDRADIIFLVYDPAKLDVGPETEAILDQLKGREYQTRIVLNKADQVRPEELMRVQGTLIWNISPLMSSTQPPVMYSTSLWSMPYELGAPLRLLRAQERAFLRDMREAIDRRVENKISSARRFAVRVRNHAKMVDCYLTTYYNHKSFFGNRKKVADDIIEKPQDYHIYEGLSTLTNISRYDLPDPETYRDFFRVNPLYEFELLSATCTYFKGCPINRLDVAIAYDLPELVGKYKKAAEIAHETHKKS